MIELIKKPIILFLFILVIPFQSIQPVLASSGVVNSERETEQRERERIAEFYKNPGEYLDPSTLTAEDYEELARGIAELERTKLEEIQNMAFGATGGVSKVGKVAKSGRAAKFFKKPIEKLKGKLGISPKATPTPSRIGKALEGTSGLLESQTSIIEIDPNKLRFSQKTAGGRGRYQPLRTSLQRGWSGPPIDVVETPGGLVTMDNTRVIIARELDIKISAVIHSSTEPLPSSMLGRFGQAKTWGEALLYRTSRNSLPSSGTLDLPLIY